MKRYCVEFKECIYHTAIILAENEDEALFIGWQQLRESDERFGEHSDGCELQSIHEEIESGYNLPVFNSEGYQGKDY